MEATATTSFGRGCRSSSGSLGLTAPRTGRRSLGSWHWCSRRMRTRSSPHRSRVNEAPGLNSRTQQQDSAAGSAAGVEELIPHCCPFPDFRMCSSKKQFALPTSGVQSGTRKKPLPEMRMSALPCVNRRAQERCPVGESGNVRGVGRIQAEKDREDRAAGPAGGRAAGTYAEAAALFGCDFA
jgi:hypothetical protein